MVELEQALVALKDAGMTLKLSKCKFAKSSVTFIGHEIGSGLRKPLLDKVKAIRDIPEPATKRALRSFIGALNFFELT